MQERVAAGSHFYLLSETAIELAELLQLSIVVVVAVVATRGTDTSSVRALVTLLRTASATVPGVVWLENSWQLTGTGDRARFAQLVDAAAGADRQ